VELTVLGAAGTWPPAGGETCGYLLRHDGTTIWLDAGTGTFARLQEHVAIDEIDAIVISHGHPDHFVDVIPCFYARHYGRLGAPGLPFYSPEGFMDQAGLLVSEDGRDVMRETYDFHTVRHGDSFTIGSFTFGTFKMTHIGVEAVGYRIEAGGAVLAYTGDTGPCDEVVDMARDADLLLAEATYQDGNTLFPFHFSASQAAEHAKRANAHRLLLTHLTPGSDPEVSRREAKAIFGGPVDVASTGMSVEVSR
jgi:ribonuclease BN (tRNA processing enzyme)